MSSTSPLAPPRWRAGLALLGAMLACVAGTRAEPTSEPEVTVASVGTVEPSATPLVELDADAIEAATAAPAAAPEPLPFDEEQLERIYAVQDIVAAASAAHGVDPALINGLIWVESKFEKRARGPAGAQGLMQLMPRTASAMAKRLERRRNSWDPDFNIHAGTLLLSRLLARFDGDVRLALAGYNRGGGTVSKWVAAGEPLPEGVESFVERVVRARAWFERLPPRAQPPTKNETETKPETKPEAKPSGAPLSRRHVEIFTARG